jgi:hypothetical protein
MIPDELDILSALICVPAGISQLYTNIDNCLVVEQFATLATFYVNTKYRRDYNLNVPKIQLPPTKQAK